MARVLQAITLGVMLAMGAVAAPAAQPVVVSSKLSSESAMLGQMIRLLLEEHGIPTVDRMTLGATPVVRKALLAGEIDLYVEYTGNAGFFLQPTERSGVEGPRTGLCAGRKARPRGQPHRLAGAGPGQQRLGAGRAS